MDKTEYHMKLEELNGLVENQDYKGALQIVNSIDWRRVKSVKTLSMVADVYEMNKEYQRCKEILLLANSRSMIGKMVLYRLVEVSLKLGETEQAADYYSKFVDAAPNDNSRFILKYKIYRAQKAPLEDQIAILEDYKDREYTERWAYELAKLYSQSGQQEKCVEACDDLVLWFSEGRYVMKAMELKMQYEPLSPSQQKKYNSALSAKKAQVPPAAPVFPKPVSVVIPEMPKSSAGKKRPKESTEELLQKMDSAGAAITQEASSAREQLEQAEKEAKIDYIPVNSPEFLGRTVDLKEQLAKSIQEVFAGMKQPHEAAKEVASEAVLGDTGEIPVQDLEPEMVETQTTVEPEAAQKIVTKPETKKNSNEVEVQREFADSALEAFDLDALLRETASNLSEELASDTFQSGETEAETTEEKETHQPKESGDVPSTKAETASRSEEKESTQAKTESHPEESESVQAEEPAEEVFDLEDLILSRTVLEEEDSRGEASAEEETLEESDAEKCPSKEEALEEDVLEQLPPEDKKSEDKGLEAAALEEALPEDESSQEAAPEKLSLEEESEESVSEGSSPEDEALKEVAPEDTSSEEILPGDTVAGEIVSSDVLPEETSSENVSPEESSTDKFDLENIILAGMDGEDFDSDDSDFGDDETNQENSSNMDDVFPKIKHNALEELMKAAHDTEAAKTRVIAELQDTADMPLPVNLPYGGYEDRLNTIVVPKREEPEQSYETKSYKPVREEALDATREIIPENISSETRRFVAPENTVPMSVEEVLKDETPEERRIRILNEGIPEKFTDEQKKIFSYFAKIPGIDQQVLDALSGVYQHVGEKTSKQGNVAVMGGYGTGKTRLSEGIIRTVCKDLGLKAVKYAHIDAADLNKKDPAVVVAKMSGGFLLIERAGLMYPDIIEKLNKALEFRTDSMIVIIEDEKTSMRGLLRNNPEFAKKFNTVISIPVFTNDELVTFARTYARENGYKMDEMGVLALYTLIGDNQTENEPMTIAKVKEIVDGAIARAGKGTRRFGRRMAGKRTDDQNRIILYEKDFEVK